MADFEVRVVGAPPPNRPEKPFASMIARMRRVLNALVLRPRALMLGGLAAFLLAIGTPHVGWDYGCEYPMRRGQPCGSVSYCAYYGIQGRRVVVPESGESCQFITFLRIDWRRIV